MQKRKSNSENLEGVIQRLIKAYGLMDGVDKSRLINSWEKILGPYIAGKTEKVELKKGKLYIKLTSAALRNELSVSKTTLIVKLNEFLGKEVIQDIIFR